MTTSRLRRLADPLADAAVDLLLGSRCAGCERPGRLLCPGCSLVLEEPARLAWPTPVPAGLVTPWAGAEYAGAVRAMVLGHKEHAMHGLRTPLSRLLATAVRCAVAGAGAPDAAVVLVPVPSRPATTRARGHDPTWTVTRYAAARLRREGYDVRARRLLRLRMRVADQGGLDATQRAANLAGSMWCPSGSVRRLSRSLPERHGIAVVVCDDVLTTGSTVREAQRALQASGLPVVAAAVAAATRKRKGTGVSW